MRLLRSWPARVPAGRAYVEDGVERLVIDGHQYWPLADVGDDVLLLEWDVAVDRDELLAFAGRARATPGRVLVAPYRLYESSFRSVPLRRPVWAHRYSDGSHVETGDPCCHWFGLGMAYLPGELVRAFAAESRAREWVSGFEDTGFSGWHHRVVTPDVPIMWEVRPVHLHYQTPEVS